jgi:hypothetical protein
VLTGEPANATSVQGQSATFSGVASGAAVGYQWFFGDAPIAGATSASLTLANLTLNQAGGYKLVASNTGGSVTSRVATLTLLPALADNSSLRTGLRSYLPFDGNYNDASGNGINASRSMAANTDAGVWPSRPRCLWAP